MKRIYIAGPMSDLPAVNYPAFNAAAAVLRAAGFEVENPAENPRPACGTWLGYMRMSLAQVARCDAVVRLVGWEDSRGAKVEVSTAEGLGLPVIPLARALEQVEVS